jgi:hypothetical protein
MSVFKSSKLKLGIMLSSLVAGTILLLFNRNNLSHEQASIELLKDSLIHHVRYEYRPIIYSNFTKIHQLKNAIIKISDKDSLSQKDREAIKEIHQQLNQLLHERN